MPVTVKLSRRFYEQFGDELASEFVDVLNNMDTTYRAELRDLVELSFEKFESRLDLRVAETRADFRSDMAAFRAEVQSEFHAVRVEMRDLKAELIKWMFLFWTGTALANLLLR